jgi:hypothetical protein
MDIETEIVPEKIIKRGIEDIDISDNQRIQIRITQGNGVVLNESPGAGKRWKGRIILSIEETNE